MRILRETLSLIPLSAAAVIYLMAAGLWLLAKEFQNLSEAIEHV